MSDLDDSIFTSLFLSEGAHQMTWEVATRCSCYSTDTRQPTWGCPHCGGLGAVFAEAIIVRGLFRAQSRWQGSRAQGELAHGEAQFTTPLSCKPGYTDRRIRDRFTVIPAVGDLTEGRIFYPGAEPVPFLFNGVQRAWRVQLQSMDQTDRVVPQP